MEAMEHYFLQFWAITNPVLLTYDDLRKELYRIWCEIYETVPVCEQRLFIVGKLYRERVLKGAAENSGCAPEQLTTAVA